MSTRSEEHSLPSLPASPIKQDASSSDIAPQQPDTPSPGKGKGRLTDSPTPYEGEHAEVAEASSGGEEEEEDVKAGEEEAQKIEEVTITIVRATNTYIISVRI